MRSPFAQYQPPDPCAGKKPSAPFRYKMGFLPAGDDLLAVWTGTRWRAVRPEDAHPTWPPMTVPEAQSACLLHKQCAGFTFSHPTKDETQKHVMHFKMAADGATAAEGWHTYKKIKTDCRPGRRPPPPSNMRYRVDVLRESPPVYIVRDFVDVAECDHMTNLTIPKMERSVVFGGGGDSGRVRTMSP